MKGYAEKRCKSMRFANALRIDFSQQRSWRSKKRVKWKDRKCKQYLNQHRSLYCNCAIRQWRYAGQQSSEICLTSNEWYAPFILNINSLQSICL